MPEPTPRDEPPVLLLHAMLLGAGADGEFAREELAALEAALAQVPELRSADLNTLVSSVARLQRRYSSARDSIGALDQLPTETLRRKAFFLAAETVLADGLVTAEEQQCLTELQRALRVDNETAARIVAVLALKHAV